MSSPPDRLHARNTSALKRRLIELVAVFGLVCAIAAAGFGYATWQQVVRRWNRQLAHAVDQSDLKEVRRLLHQGASGRIRGPESGSTALIRAVETDDPDLVRLALARGADTNATGNYFESGMGYGLSHEGSTPLMVAAQRQHPAIVTLLLHAGARPDLHDSPLGSTALMATFHRAGRSFEEHPSSARRKTAEVVRALLDAGADVDAQNAVGLTVLWHAAQSNRPDAAIVSLLLQRGANPDVIPSGYGNATATNRTLLHWIAESGPPGVAALLLKAGARPNIRDSRGDTPLTLAAARGEEETVRLLLRAGVPCPPVLREDWFPLSRAVAHYDRTAARRLLEKDADPNTRGPEGLTPLMFAVQQDDVRLLRLILRRRARVRAVDQHHRTALMYALRAMGDIQHRVEMTRLLLQNGADPNLADDQRTPPLVEALGGNYVPTECALLLIPHGADPNGRAPNDETALTAAAGWGHSAVVRALLAAGADPRLAARPGWKPLDAALDSEHSEIAALLRNALTASDRPRIRRRTRSLAVR
jgi:ankyrin repeat protein